MWQIEINDNGHAIIEVKIIASAGAKLSGIDSAEVVASTKLAKQAHAEIIQYLQGKLQIFTVPIAYSQNSTPFQQAVWDALRAIPYGETSSYKQVAEAIGKPAASRAVGNACGKNDLLLLVPCHRVLASGGGLGGFSSGLELKQLLINLEKRSKYFDEKRRK